MSLDDPGTADAVEGAVADPSRRKAHVEHLGKRFGRVIALDDVTLSILENEIIAIVGDNGAGKSTLMHILSGVYGPTSGTIYYEGERVTFSSPEDAREYGIETVYQDLALMDDLDVATNIFMGQFPQRGFPPFRFVDWPETYRRAKDLLEGTLNRPDIDPRTEVEFLSGGQRQLVAVARALAFEPDLVILDEPTSALSVDATNLVHNTIRRLRDEGHTVIIVSHSLEEVFGLADRIAVLYHGELVEVAHSGDIDEEILTNLIATGTRTG